ncbi:YqeG family HAD IIIA-type phosphatase [Waterburya agarophytonicola K14]|uniref:YqeG family HAD IIIA-type phosphatase n=1 Tax=Waterburya agarophytonicola KI4 TaxID=2874699 RepID=A0A964FGK0_9CYAN|nr:YqeG family HAD IIIA-type phosphatase [Waterburya agarophytonicola]MCC0178990.1 YqeG family HAD IIIA-type phosphatase [Waterburya agarophytonicola KI4]
MTTIALLQPNLVLGGTIFDLTPEILQDQNIEGLILDVDETLVPFKQKETSQELQQWIAQIRQTTPIWLVSNNISHTRIGNIARSVDLPFISAAKKPSRRKLKEAAEAMNLPVEKVAMVGDRLFTDVLAGNRLGMFTVLVEPMIDPVVAVRSHPIRDFEIWISQLLGVSLLAEEKNVTKGNNS